MKLLYFIPEPVSTSRADVAVLFGKSLARHDLQTHLVGMPGEPPSAEGYAGVSMPPEMRSRLGRELAYLRTCISSLRAHARQSDLIQVRDMVLTAAFVLAGARLAGRPFAFWMSYLMPEGRLERARDDLAQATRWQSRLRARAAIVKSSLERWLLYRVLLPRCDHIFVQSDAMLQHVAQRGIAVQRMTPVPMGVDCERLNPATIVGRRLDGWQGVPVIGYLGTLTRSRRFDQLVDALSLVHDRFPQARLLLIGDAPTQADVTDLQAYAEARGLSAAIHITGWLPSDEAWSLLAGADVGVSHFPRGEVLDTCSPTKIIEYLALALPCVGNDNPDQAWVLQESDAGWLTAGTPRALADGLIEALTNPEAARLRAAKGPDFVRSHRSYAILARQVAETYGRVFAPHDPAQAEAPERKKG